MTGDTSLFDLSGRIAVVTGGNGGIGRAIALGLAHAGASVAVLARAAKGAIVQLTKSMAIELASHNIQVNAIAPGWIETDMTDAVRKSPMNDAIVARTPAGRWGRSEEMIGAAVFLASRGSDFVTGVTLAVDGGYSIF